LNFTCVNIVHVEIKETCPVLRTGRDHKGGEKISTSKNYFPPEKFIIKRK
jgi:hypothetical protein